MGNCTGDDYSRMDLVVTGSQLAEVEEDEKETMLRIEVGKSSGVRPMPMSKFSLLSCSVVSRYPPSPSVTVPIQPVPASAHLLASIIFLILQVLFAY